MAIKIFILIFVLSFGTVSFAQSIDCAQYAQEVIEITGQVNAASDSLVKAQNKLAQCQSIKVVAESPEYQKSISTKTLNMGVTVDQ